MNKLPYIFSLILLLSATLGSPAAKAQDRKGWSPQAKGAVIGGGSGAILGAVINKRNRVVGGVVGGVVGAGAGYAIGKHTDNKRKERARIAAANHAAAVREAEYRRELARRDARQNSVAARQQTAVVPVNSLTASAAAMPGAMVLPATTSSAYLPNDSYGDASKPYSTEQIRRKSW